jgi:tetratricopeptide (TPR) repeat protein
MEIKSLDTTTPTLCLNMIVKNEGKIIQRLLESVLPIIDCYCICDTGSTDNTEEIITEFFKNHNIPGKIVKETFKNFEHNRNVALQACIGMSDYVILLDADMILQVKNFDKRKLRMGDFSYILQGNEHFYYQNTRIVKNNGAFKYSGVTHEYINFPQGAVLVKLDKNELFILDIGDGGAKADKFERDVRLLLQGIEDVKDLPGRPNYDRYHFYLANTYHDSGYFDKAIEYYKKRIEIGGWDQEIWYSYYRIGLSYKKMNQINDAICYWMDGYNFYPKRVENLYEIVTHYRHISKNKLANVFYQLAKNILDQKLDKDNYLFLHNDVYTFKLYYEYSIIGYYLGVSKINDEVVNILNHSDDGGINNSLLNNMKFYKDILKPIQTVNLTNNFIVSVNGENTSFCSSSSCLIHNENKDGYLLNVRYVNYYITDKGQYLNCDKHIATINKYHELDMNLNIQKEKVFDLNFEDRRYIGVEDVRIFKDIETNKLIFTGTGFHKNETIGIMKGFYNADEDKLLANELKCGFSNVYCEKNWVFVDYKKSTHMIYSWNPLKICKVDDNTNILNLVETKQMPKFFSHVRGSTCGFKYSENNEIWFMLHLVSYEQPRFYYHIFAVFDENMNLLRYSAPFKFGETCIEYSLGIVVENDRVLVNYSEWDRSTKIAIYDKNYIDSLIKYTP